MRRTITIRLVLFLLLTLGFVQGEAWGEEARPTATHEASGSTTAHPEKKVSRLGAINLPREDLDRFLGLGFDFVAGVHPDKTTGETPEALQSLLKQRGIEYFNTGLANTRLSDMNVDQVPLDRRLLKRGPGDNKYINRDCVCAGWDEPYRFQGQRLSEKLTREPQNGIILEDFLNRALCYCDGCEADYRRDTGAAGFPGKVYPTPHYEDTTSLDPNLIAWDQQRTARHFGILAEPIHKAGKKLAVAGVSRWIVGPEAARQVDYVMFYTYYAGRRLPPNFMRNWKYWHDHMTPENLWLIFGYFREYHTCHTRLMLANLPDGVNLAFWACHRQAADTSTRDDPVYASDVASTHLVPIRIGVLDSQATRTFRAKDADEWRKQHVEKVVLGLERLGFDATPVSALDNLDQFELLYLEDVECLAAADIDRIKQAEVPVLAAGLTAARDERGRPWERAAVDLPRTSSADLLLRLPSPVILRDGHLNIETQRLSLEHPWFEFMFETCSPKRGDTSHSRPYTDPSFYHGVRKYQLSLIPSRTYGEFLDHAIISQQAGQPLAVSSETREPMIVYDPAVRQVYSTVRFSDYVDTNDLTECGFGYEMRQFCFLQIIDALTLERRGVAIDPYLMTAVRRSAHGYFLTIGNAHDEARTVTVTLEHAPKAVRIDHQPYDKWNGRRITLPSIGPRDAMQVYIDEP
jgi:hypothetical protein